MPFLEIQHLAGPPQRRPLTKTEPVSIGSHPSNDLRVDEEGVSVIHCRVSWNGADFEVMAAGVEGVEVNGTLVQHAPLAEGDLLRIGTVDVTFRENRQPAAEAEAEDVGLAPVTDDEIPLLKRAADVAREMGGGGGSRSPAASKKEPPPKATSRPAAGRPDSQSPAPSAAKKEFRFGDEAKFADRDPWDYADGDKFPDPARDRRDRKKKPEDKSLAGRLKGRLAGPPARPGEQDIARSPFVLGLTAGVAALVLAALTVWLVIGRQTTQKHYDAALRELDAKNYQQAVDLFESFIQKYPRHRLSESARYGLGKARIEMAIAGGTPNWSRGLNELQTFIKQHRDRPHFNDQKPKLSDYAQRIAFSAAEAARSAAGRPNTKVPALERLLVVSRDAGGLMARLHPPDDQPVELQHQLDDACRKAENAIEKKRAFLAAVESMQASIAARRTHEALREREALLNRYGEFVGDRRMVELLAGILDAERSLVVADDAGREALAAEREAATPLPLSFTRHTRSGSGEESVGRTVVALAKDCCYGIDTITGDPLWRRVIGMDTPFFPLAVESSVPGLLLFDTNHGELMLLDRRSGRLIWRQPLEPDAQNLEPDSVNPVLSGPPLVHEGRIYAATLPGRLYQIELETGRISKRLTFAGPLLSPPVLVRSDSQLVVAGRESVLYTLALRPLSCLAVSFSGHRGGEVEAPLLVMGPLLLLTENDRAGAARLRVFDTRAMEPDSESPAQSKHTLTQIDADEVTGRIHNRPVIRGRRLFVTSSPERITAFNVSEEEGQKPLVKLAETRVSGDHSGPLFLRAGADGRLWMAGSAFRSFGLETDTIVYDEANRVAIGISTQPLQLVDRYFFVGRRQPYHRAVLFTPVEVDQLTSRWRTVLGSSLIAFRAVGDEALCVSETGDVYPVSSAEILAGGFRRNATATFPVDDSLPSPLRAAPVNRDYLAPGDSPGALRSARLAVYAGGIDPRLWIVDATGRIVEDVALPAALEANPVALDAGLVLPLPNRLAFVPSADQPTKLRSVPVGARPAVEDYPLPIEEGRKPRWTHLISLGGDELLAVNDAGRLLRIRYRTSPIPHLDKSDSLEFDQPIDVPPELADGRLFIADASGRLRMYDAATFDLLSEVKLDAPASSQPWVAGGALYVETGRKHLHQFSLDAKLAKRWTRPLEGSPLAGRPLVDAGRLIVARQNGEVWALDPETGEVRNRLHVGQPVNLGPRQVGNLLVLATIDGSLHRIDSLLDAGRAGDAE